MPNPVYFIGAGPGDPKYLTQEGFEALRGSILVFALDPYPRTFAAHLEGKEVRDPFEYDFAGMCQEVEKYLPDGPVAYLIPGDLTVFSPFLPLVEHFAERSRVIPGVGVVNAAAALLRRTLEMPGVSHTVLLTSPKHIDKYEAGPSLGDLSKLAGTVVLYMNNRPLADLAAELSRGFDPDTPVAVLYRIGMDGERIYRGSLSTIAGIVGDDDVFGLVSGDPSMAIILIGDVLEARADPGFWDKRKERFWDRKKR